MLPPKAAAPARSTVRRVAFAIFISLLSEIELETAWVAHALRAMQTVKLGMTRSDLARLFTIESGLSTFSQQTYVYRQCPYIKVDVEFSASDSQERPTDKIVAWRTFD